MPRWRSSICRRVSSLRWCPSPTRHGVGGIRATARAIGAGLSGACLAAFYLVPAVMNRPFIAEYHFLQGRFDYRQNFSHPDAILAAILTLLPVLWLAVRLPREQRATPWKGATRFWAAEVVAACVMMTPLSVRLWDALLAAAVPAVSAALLHRAHTGYRLARRTAAGGSSFSRVSPGGDGHGVHRAHRRGGPSRVRHRRDATSPVLRPARRGGAEYQTRWMAESKLAPWALPPESSNRPPRRSRRGMDRSRWSSGGAGDRPAHVIETPQAQVRLKTAYFPGWTGANRVISSSAGRPPGGDAPPGPGARGAVATLLPQANGRDSRSVS